MKKLAILSTVAALVAFGWAGMANADPGHGGEAVLGLSCTDNKGVAGLADNMLVIAFTENGDYDSYAVEIVCLARGIVSRQQSLVLGSRYLCLQLRASKV